MNRTTQKIFYFGLFISLIVLLKHIVVIDYENTKLFIEREKFIDIQNEVNNETKRKILFWTNFYDDPFWGLKKSNFNENYFKNLKCLQSNCELSFNFTNHENISNFDALVFHTSESHPRSIPSVRYSHQVYIMGTKESPGYPPHNLIPQIGFYNLTLNYRINSDIPWFYGYMRDKITKENLYPSSNINWRKVDEDFYGKFYQI